MKEIEKNIIDGYEIIRYDNGAEIKVKLIEEPLPIIEIIDPLTQIQSDLNWIILKQKELV